MNNNQSENKALDIFTPNAPIKYATAGGRGVMIGCGIITALYVIGVIVGLCVGIWLEQPSSAFPSIYRNWIYWLHLGDV